MRSYSAITNNLRGRFEQALTDEIRALPMHAKLKEAMLYAVAGGGKRLRPILLLESFGLFSDAVQEAMPYAVALEMIHNYSLVHDDLPAMDDDDFRRERPSVHRAFDEGLAILAGDALLSGAFEIALAAAGENPRAIRAVAALASAAGTDGMLSGQVMDLYDTVNDIDHLLQLYDKKTGRLILAACEAGGIAGGAGPDDLAHLKAYAFHLGAAFQIQDDLLDEQQDQSSGNMSILRFIPVQEARENMRMHTEKALENLAKIAGADTAGLTEITRSLVDRKV